MVRPKRDLRGPTMSRLRSTYNKADYCLGGIRVDCQETNCISSPRLAQAMKSNLLREVRAPHGGPELEVASDGGETTVGAHPDVAAPHRPVLDRARSHRLNIGTLVGYRSVHGAD